jgi:hypothetical protein
VPLSRRILANPNIAVKRKIQCAGTFAWISDVTSTALFAFRSITSKFRQEPRERRAAQIVLDTPCRNLDKVPAILDWA